MAPNSYCTIVTVFFVNIIRMQFNTQIHICSLLGCLGCSVARVPRLAWVPRLARVSRLARVPRLAGLALVAWLLRCLAGAWGLRGAQEFKSPRGPSTHESSKVQSHYIEKLFEFACFRSK